MDKDITPVYITSFVNPHLFWLFEVFKENERKTLEIRLSQTASRENIANINQVVAIKDSFFKRALIKEVCRKDNIQTYLCWLLDYGILVESKNIYSIPEDLQKLHPLTKQACLNNIIGLHQIFGEDIQYEESLTFSIGTSKLSQEYINNAQITGFRLEQEINEVLCGDIIIFNNDNTTCSLRELLVKEKSVSVNENLFKKALFENEIHLKEKKFEKVKGALRLHSRNSQNSKEVLETFADKRKISLIQSALNNIGPSQISIGRGVHRTFSKQVQKMPEILNNSDYLESWIEQTRKMTSSSTENYFSDNESISFEDAEKQKAIPTSEAIKYNEEDKCKAGKQHVKQESKCNQIALASCDLKSEFNSCVEDKYFEKQANKNTDISQKKPEVSIWDSIRDENQTEIIPKALLPAGMNLNTQNIRNKGLEKNNALKISLSKQSNFNKRNKTESKTTTDSDKASCYLKNDSSENSLLTSIKKSDSFKSNDSNISDDNYFDDHNIKTKIGCTCIQCVKWNSKVTSEDVEINFVSHDRPTLEIEKPPLLLKTSEEYDEILEIKSRSSLKFEKEKTKVEKSVTPKILVHGYMIPTPTDNIFSVSFHKDIHNSLISLKFLEARQIQAYTWPALMRRMSAFIISSAKSGKTMAYMPVICTYVQEKLDRYPNLPDKEYGPLVLILCKGCKATEQIYDIVQKMFDLSKWKPNVAIAVPPLDKNCLHQFQKQCDILVATPLTLTSLLRSRIINLKRLCHLVIEEGEVIFDKFIKEMEIIFGVAQNMLDHRLCNYSIQLIVTSEKWSPQMEKLLRNLYSTPIVIIGNSLEAAVYGRVDLELVFLKEHHKKSKVIDILKGGLSSLKTIIICNTKTEIYEALEYLHLNSIGAIAITSENTKEEIYEYETSWKNSQGKNSIDEQFNCSLDITDAELLIHYSLPSSWTSFSFRFKSMIDNYKSPLSKKNIEYQCKAYIFIDQCCEIQFPRLVGMLQRMNKQIPSKYMEYYQKELNKLEENKALEKVDICQNLKLFGNCNKEKCLMRHLFIKGLDENDYLPKSGVIHFQILHIKEVALFSIKLLEHINVDGTVNKYEDVYDKMEESLKKAIDLTKDCSSSFAVGDMYAVFSDENLRRCKLLKIIAEERITKIAKQVLIKLIDYGTDLEINTSCLYDLPENFKTIPPQAVDLYIANLVPPDSDERWSMDCKKKLKQNLKQADYDNANSYFMGQIVLQISNTIWVKNAYLQEKLEACDTIVTKMNLKKTLQELKIADETEDPLNRLYVLCKNAEITLPKFNLLPKCVSAINKKKYAEQIKPQWAFLEEDADYNEVYFCSANSPHEFYIRLKKFDCLFQQLQRDIQSLIKQPFYPEEYEVEVGKCYLAKDPESEEYGRVLIVKLEDEVAVCLFVDFGDIANINQKDLKFLGNDFILKLPFQAIECRLHGISPPLEHWSADATDILYNYSLETGSGFFRTLYASTLKTDTAKMTGGQKYSILLLCNSSDRGILINKLIIDCGLAITSDGENLDCEISLPKSAEDEKEEEIEEELSALNKDGEDKVEISEISNGDILRNLSYDPSDVEIFDPQFFLKLFFKEEVNKPQDKNSTKNSRIENDFQILKALPSSNCLTPFVTWYQEDTHIYLTILLSCIKDYDIKISRGRLFSFQTNENGNYLLKLTLYGKVEDDFQHSSGLNVKVILTKSISGEWPRLVNPTDPQRHIKYDASKIDIPEDTKKPFLKIDINEEECELNEIIIGSDEDYSESDVESSSS